MWLIFGAIAIIATIANLYLYKMGMDYKLAMALGLSFTALTLCAEYSLISGWVQREDWAAVWEIVNFERVLWFCTIVSILLNMAPVLLERRGSK